VTAVRWFADRPIDEADGRGGTCRCGEPDALVNTVPDDPQAECVAVCLGTRGLLIAQMAAMFTDGPDADLFIYEWGTYHGGTDDPFSVLVSENGRDWILVAEAVCNDPGRPYASIDLGGRRGHYLFVKVLPAAERVAYAEGPEILAIEALHPSLDLGS